MFETMNPASVSPYERQRHAEETHPFVEEVRRALANLPAVAGRRSNSEIVRLAIEVVKQGLTGRMPFPVGSRIRRRDRPSEVAFTVGAKPWGYMEPLFALTEDRHDPLLVTVVWYVTPRGGLGQGAASEWELDIMIDEDERVPDDAKALPRPLCPFCSHPWPERAVWKFDEDRWGSDSMGDYCTTTIRFETHCENCGRLMYARETKHCT